MRTFTIETSAGPILFRPPHPHEAGRMFGGIVLLQIDPRPREDVENNPPDWDRLEEAIKQRDQLIAICAKQPLVSMEKVVSTPEILDVNDLSLEERTMITNKLLEAGGFGTKEAERIAPLEVTAPA